ncbi:50S ribosomal protein L11 methyltransferase [Longimicrobium terrae]|uniref:Protein arginine N-methyltransferase 1 n=1 Tax=Longimicrobium terrae TaxID=1639882 RepID=A0A841GXU5_9BACT|nr:protein arginine N-methyltransferase 1 [Longimicrobium terrae]MBB6070567.1 protein arginine N-methyltransferase 1 [Longimicrobium terrae]NNC29553.1 methyltransferase domain-containing protein [Longimicrobium terrae]
MTRSYNVRSFGLMAADHVRIDAYAAALEQAVRPGSVVLDVGTGTGILALLACRLGARRVYAIEPNDAVQLARLAARDNGFADRIEFIQALSMDVELPERADVIVSDLRGVLPVAFPHITAIADVRERMLAPGGVLIPRRDTVRAAPVEAPREHAAITSPWTEHGLGLDMSSSRAAALNDWGKVHFAAGQLLAAPQTWAVLDYRTITDPNLKATMEWTVERDGTGHGVSVWFDADLAEGVGFTTGPEGPQTIYGTAFLPWLEPVPLVRGDRIRMMLQARGISDDYVWVWDTTVERADGSRVRFRQSTLRAGAFPSQQMRRRGHDFAPMLGEQGRADREILGLMDGTATLGEIATEARRRFPALFTSWEAALSRVGQLSETFSE